MLAIVNSKQCELLDHPRLLAQFAGLQRRTGRSGRDSIDHRPNQRDDLASSVAGAAVGAVMSAGRKGPLAGQIHRVCESTPNGELRVLRRPTVPGRRAVSARMSGVEAGMSAVSTGTVPSRGSRARSYRPPEDF